MNLLVEIDGKKGENLTSAVLRYLLLRSLEIRESILHRISDVSPTGPIICDSNFSCQLEMSTNDYANNDDQSEYQNDKGRIDLVLETDNMLIGIENKLFAGFQENQPDKYFQTLEERKKQLDRLWNNRYEYFLIIIAPQSQSKYVENKIEISKNKTLCVYITWEEITSSIKNVVESQSSSLDKVTGTVALQFIDYIDQKINAFRDITRLASHLWRLSNYKESELHYQFIEMIKQILPAHSNTRASYTTGYAGYSYYYEDGEHQVWLGFISKNSGYITEDDFLENHNSELIIFSTLVINETITPKQLNLLSSASSFLYNIGKEANAWRIDFSPDWVNIENWRECFQPFIDAVEEHCKSKDQSSYNY